MTKPRPAIRRLPGDEAADLLAAGHGEEIWIELPGVFRYLQRLGYQPRDLARAILRGDIQVAVIEGELNVNVLAMVGWLAQQTTRQRTLH